MNRRWALVGGAALVLVIGVVAAVLALSGGGGNKAGASVVQTVPVSSAHDPFTPPQGTDTPPTQPVTPGPNYQTDGGHVGLYGGTLNIAACDKNQLTTYLQANPDKAAAWAGVLGIQVSDIPTYVNGLTPMILRSDTLVTNHGYSDGQATASPSVLQAGTAVLVDDKGEPVTKCYCGNPLTAPPTYTSAPTYEGPTWSYWNGGQNYTTINPAPSPVTVFVMVDVRTNTTIYLQPGQSVPSATNPTTTAPPTTTTPSSVPTTVPLPTTTQPPTTTTLPPTTTAPPTTTTTTAPPTTTTTFDCPYDDPDTPSSDLTPGTPEYQDEAAEEACGSS